MGVGSSELYGRRRLHLCIFWRIYRLWRLVTRKRDPIASNSETKDMKRQWSTRSDGGNWQCLKNNRIKEIVDSRGSDSHFRSILVGYQTTIFLTELVIRPLHFQRSGVQNSPFNCGYTILGSRLLLKMRDQFFKKKGAFAGSLAASGGADAPECRRAIEEEFSRGELRREPSEGGGGMASTRQTLDLNRPTSKLSRWPTVHYRSLSWREVKRVLVEQ